MQVYIRFNGLLSYVTGVFKTPEDGKGVVTSGYLLYRVGRRAQCVPFVFRTIFSAIIPHRQLCTYWMFTILRSIVLVCLHNLLQLNFNKAVV